MTPAGDTLDFLVTGAILPQNLDTIFDALACFNGALKSKAVGWESVQQGHGFRRQQR